MKNPVGYFIRTFKKMVYIDSYRERHIIEQRRENVITSNFAIFQK